MSKDSHFTGQPVYRQVLKLLDKEKILKISRETNGSEAYITTMTFHVSSLAKPPILSSVFRPNW